MFSYIDSGSESILKINEESKILECPYCEETYTHQCDVEVFNRKQDAETGLHVLVDGGCRIDSDIKNNPSPRRDGITLTFSCEWCHAYFKIHIVQHKGQTFMYSEPGESFKSEDIKD